MAKESEAQRRRRLSQERMRAVADVSGPEFQKRLTEMLSAGGVSEGRTALELLYMVPDGFRVAYMQLFHRALGMADGGSGARGAGNEATAVLGRAGGKAARTTGKRFKQHWVVRDDDALRLKERVDKRLRGLAREILEELMDIDTGGGRPRCVGCGQVVAVGWHFCAMCGRSLREER